jgi:hypothetical protein
MEFICYDIHFMEMHGMASLPPVSPSGHLKILILCSLFMKLDCKPCWYICAGYRLLIHSLNEPGDELQVPLLCTTND